MSDVKIPTDSYRSCSPANDSQWWRKSLSSQDTSMIHESNYHYFGEEETVEDDDRPAIILATPFEVDVHQNGLENFHEKCPMMKKLREDFPTGFWIDKNDLVKTAEELLKKLDVLFDGLLQNYSKKSIDLVHSFLQHLDTRKLRELLQDGRCIPEKYKNEGRNSVPPIPHLMANAKKRAEEFLEKLGIQRKKQVAIILWIEKIQETMSEIKALQRNWSDHVKKAMVKIVETHASAHWRRSDRRSRSRSRSRSVEHSPTARVPRFNACDSAPLPIEVDSIHQPKRVRTEDVMNLADHFELMGLEEPQKDAAMERARIAIQEKFAGLSLPGVSYHAYVEQLIQDQFTPAEYSDSDCTIEDETNDIGDGISEDSEDQNTESADDMEAETEYEAMSEPAMVRLDISLPDATDKSMHRQPERVVFAKSEERPSSVDRHQMVQVTFEDPIHDQAVLYATRHFQDNSQQYIDKEMNEGVTISMKRSEDVKQTTCGGGPSGFFDDWDADLPSVKMTVKPPNCGALHYETRELISNSRNGLADGKVVVPSSRHRLRAFDKFEERLLSPLLLEANEKFCMDQFKLFSNPQSYGHESMRNYILGDDIIARLNPDIFLFKKGAVCYPSRSANVIKICGPSYPYQMMYRFAQKVRNMPKAELRHFTADKIVWIFSYEYAIRSKGEFDFIKDLRDSVILLKKVFGDDHMQRIQYADPSVPDKKLRGYGTSAKKYLKLHYASAAPVTLILVTIPQYGNYRERFRLLNKEIRKIHQDNYRSDNMNMKFELIDWAKEVDVTEDRTPGQRYSKLLRLLCKHGIPTMPPMLLTDQ